MERGLRLGLGVWRQPSPVWLGRWDDGRGLGSGAGGWWKTGGCYLNVLMGIAIHPGAPTPGLLGAWVRLRPGDLLCVMGWRPRDLSLLARRSTRQPPSLGHPREAEAPSTLVVQLAWREGTPSPNPGSTAMSSRR